MHTTPPDKGVYIAEIKRSNPQLALAELRAAGEIYSVSRGVVMCSSLKIKEELAMTHRILELITTCSPANVQEAMEEVELDFDGSFRVRVSRIDDTLDASKAEMVERNVGELIHRRGNPVDLEDPDVEFRLLFTENKCYIGRLLTETTGFSGREPTEKPFFKPGSMSPVLARALTNIAGGYGDASLLDPLVGTGGILVEAGLAGARVVGTDSRIDMVEGANTNLARYLEGGWCLCVADARKLPFKNNAVECAVTDFPYGRASSVEAPSLDQLLDDVLEELSRTVRRRVVVVSDGWLDNEVGRAGFEVQEKIKDRVHRSLTRHIHVLSPGSRHR